MLPGDLVKLLGSREGSLRWCKSQALEKNGAENSPEVVGLKLELEHDRFPYPWVKGKQKLAHNTAEGSFHKVCTRGISKNV